MTRKNSVRLLAAMLLSLLLLVALHSTAPESFHFDLLRRLLSPKARAPPASSRDAQVILQRVSENGTRPCHNISTEAAYFFGLPMEGNGEEMITLSTEVSHKFWIVSYAADGSRRCHGGDFYEIDLSGHQWKSRPSVTDLGDGSYLVELRVDGEFTGIYTLRAILLYSNFHGMDHSATEWAVDKEVFRLQIHFTSSTGGSTRTTLPLCTSSDFTSKKPWLGKWTRTKFDESCALDEDGRYLCLRDDEQCDESQCSGALERLESNGWVYSAHCKFRIWSTTEAWKCLDGKKLFFWGDSNHRDTIRNLLNLVLGMNEIIEQRSIIINVTNPANPAQNLRVFQIYNGAPDPGKVFLGLRSLDEPAYLELVKKEFFQGGVPDAVILNSGLHDGHAWKIPGSLPQRPRPLHCSGSHCCGRATKHAWSSVTRSPWLEV
ncbi:hypothetical protein SELMODRAFT_442281 [Selaginella moellendorffii]|uniref:Uncharacterized protein n=2 Tax=Selaginella moellendorffii TaxID=88036 RepID=D8RS80_SELML|nr:hypothetical protein SELMODRAFT_442281 [Selaginella moellendorffii]